MTTAPRDDRKARLAAALRQNLHRRKAAVRDAAAVAPPEADCPPQASKADD